MNGSGGGEVIAVSDGIEWGRKCEAAGREDGVDEGLTQSMQECPLVYNKMGYSSKKRLFSILKVFSLSAFNLTE